MAAAASGCGAEWAGFMGSRSAAAGLGRGGAAAATLLTSAAAQSRCMAACARHSPSPVQQGHLLCLTRLKELSFSAAVAEMVFWARGHLPKAVLASERLPPCNKHPCSLSGITCGRRPVRARLQAPEPEPRLRLAARGQVQRAQRALRIRVQQRERRARRVRQRVAPERLARLARHHLREPRPPLLLAFRASGTCVAYACGSKLARSRLPHCGWAGSRAQATERMQVPVRPSRCHRHAGRRGSV